MHWTQVFGLLCGQSLEENWGASFRRSKFGVVVGVGTSDQGSSSISC